MKLAHLHLCCFVVFWALLVSASSNGGGDMNEKDSGLASDNERLDSERVALLRTTLANQSFLEDTWVPCSVGRAGVGVKVGEGDNITPVGSWRLESVMYRADRVSRPVSQLPVVAIERDMAWSDDSRDPAYNQLVWLPCFGSCENLWLDSHVYDLLIVSSYNRFPVVAGKGSAIFVHLLATDAQGNIRPTAGCLGLLDTHLRQLIGAATPLSQWIVG